MLTYIQSTFEFSYDFSVKQIKTYKTNVYNYSIKCSNNGSVFSYSTYMKNESHYIYIYFSFIFIFISRVYFGVHF